MEGEPTQEILQKIESAELRAEVRTALFQVLRKRQDEFSRLVRFSCDGAIETILLKAKRVDRAAENHDLALLILEPVEREEVIAELRKGALNEVDPATLMEMVVSEVTQVLRVDFCKILELQDWNKVLVVRAAHGWDRDVAGVKVPANPETQAGYTVESLDSIVVEDLAAENRFQGSVLLEKSQVSSGVTVPIQGSSQPFGVLGVHSVEKRTFSLEEVYFLESVADVLGIVLQRRQAEGERRELMDRLESERERLETVVKQMPAGVILAEAPSGKLILGNAEVERIWRHPFVEAGRVDEYSAYRGFHPDGSPLEPEKWPLARALSRGETIIGEEVEFERGDKSRGFLSISAAPIRSGDGSIVAAVVAFVDITRPKMVGQALVQRERELEQLTESLEERVEQRTREATQLASSLTIAEQRERRRVAQILHDDLQQLLFGAHIQLQRSAEQYRRRAMGAGAKGFLLKTDICAHLLPAIRQVLQGEHWDGGNSCAGTGSSIG